MDNRPFQEVSAGSPRPESESPTGTEGDCNYRYVGDELQLFAQAKNWKDYLRSRLARHIQGDVLEVGAGMGGTTRFLCDGTQRSWLCLEPDAALADGLRRLADSGQLPLRAEVLVGSTGDLPPSRLFDAILYIDVLEHIERDGDELERASRHLKPGGKLIVLSPSHNFLYSEFDRAIGHFRRYNRRLLTAAGPPAFRLMEMYYLDVFGMLLSLANRFLLRSGHPTLAQIRFWDSWVVPSSRWVDPLLLRRLGKTIVAVWAAPAGPGHAAEERPE
jgi:SAM-dependent methyltransferase